MPDLTDSGMTVSLQANTASPTALMLHAAFYVPVVRRFALRAYPLSDCQIQLIERGSATGAALTGRESAVYCNYSSPISCGFVFQLSNQFSPIRIVDGFSEREVPDPIFD